MNFPTTEFDIIVVGAGPAGCRSAMAAAAEGVKVLLVDSKRRMGEEPHCGEFVPKRLFSDCGLGGASIIQIVDAMETRILESPSAPYSPQTGPPPSKAKSDSQRPKGDRRYGTQTRVTKSPGYMIDRVRFDRDLAKEAAGSGATVMAGCRFVRFENDRCVVRCDSQEVFLRGACVIAADGAISTVAASLGLRRLDVLQGAQVEAPLPQPLDKTFVFLSKAFVGGYGWLFPKGTVANVGVGIAPGHGVGLKSVMEDFLRLLQEQEMIRPGRLASSSGLIPVSGIRQELTSHNVIFAGDSAGLTHPITGAGIPQAVISGDLAGKAAAAFVKSGARRHLVDYEHEIRALYAGVIGHALSKRALMMRNWHREEFHSVCSDTWIAFDGYKRRVRGL